MPKRPDNPIRPEEAMEAFLVRRIPEENAAQASLEPKSCQEVNLVSIGWSDAVWEHSFKGPEPVYPQYVMLRWHIAKLRGQSFVCYLCGVRHERF